MIIIGQYMSLSGLEKENIEGNKAPEMDCYHFIIRNSTMVNICAIKCNILSLYMCHDIYISSSLIKNIEIKECSNIHFVMNTITESIKKDKESTIYWEYNTIECDINETRSKISR